MSLDFKGLAGVAEATGLSNAAGNSMGIDGIFPSLSMKQRVIGFAVCFSVGLIISCMSSLSLYSLNMTQFAIFYTLGNVIALFSTSFLFGPLRQLKNMFALKRLAATLLYLATLIGTLVVAFTTQSVAAVIVLVIIQFIALIWYTLSYIPFAREMICQGMRNCVGK